MPTNNISETYRGKYGIYHHLQILSTSYLKWETIIFVCLQFIGNTDGDTQVTTRFREVLYTTAIRVQPTNWNTHCSMRFEMIGCYH